MSERRITRSSSKKQSKEQQLTESIKPPSVTQLKKPTARQLNLEKLKLFFTLKLTNQEKEEYTKDFTQYYMWEYKVWRDYLLENIEKDDLNAVLFWLNKVTDFPSIERRIDDDVYAFMRELLNKMRDMKREYLFWDRPYFNQLKKVLKPEVNWWYNHLYDSLDQPNYIKKLMDHSWKIISGRLIEDIAFYKKPNQILINYIINHIYTKDDLEGFRFNNYKFNAMSNIFLDNLKRDGLTTTEKDNIRYYLNYLILKRGKSLPPLTFDTETTPDGMIFYSYSKGLYPFIIKCLKMNETSILESFVKAFDIKREANNQWFLYILENIIRPNDFTDLYRYRIDINDIKKLVSFIIKAYKINLNNMYMPLTHFNIGNMESLNPILNPKLWLDSNIPVMAWAVLYKNIDAIDFFIEHGAILNRCVISMQDLTNDPAILGRFDRESKARKIQVAYSKYKYSPSHPSQQQRATAFKEKYQTAQSIPPIEEEQTGGKKKINKKRA